MKGEESDMVKGLREELSLAEGRLVELIGELNRERSANLLNDDALSSLKKEIGELKKEIKLKKELIMILGDEEFCYEHGDIFDRFLTMSGEPFEDEIIRVGYPLRGIGMALLMEIREKYYKMIEERKEKK